jgi:hypothetical protein
MAKKDRLAWLLAALLPVSLATGWSSDTPGRSRSVKVRGAVMPIYDEAQRLLAVLRLESEFPDFQTRGFFRIGVLPMTVIEGARLEIVGTNGLARKFFAASTRLQKRFPGGAIELKRFSVRLPNNSEPFLVVTSAQPSIGGWNLRGGVSIRVAGSDKTFLKGSIGKAPDGSVVFTSTDPDRAGRETLIPAD